MSLFAFTTDSPQDQQIMELIDFYRRNRKGAVIKVQADLFSSHTANMSLRDLREHDGPFKGMKQITCIQGAREETALVAPNGDVLPV